MRFFLLALLAGCLPELPDQHLPSEPDHDWDEDGLTEAQGDCDDEDATIGTEASYWTDGDGDGWGAGESVLTCAPAADQVLEGGDCDDARDDVHPGADERCNGFDDDCDDEIDEAAIDGDTYYEDFDEDGYGDDAVALLACEPPKGHVATGGDCDDDDADYHPGAPESDCTDPNDYNCDGSTGQDDADGDGVVACEDCDDGDETITVSSFYGDVDADGYGDPADVVTACEAPEGYVADATDCDDGRDTVHPGAAESCNGRDDDCDDLLDDGDPDVEGLATWHLDADGDGHGDPDATTEACARPDGYVADADADDCDDADVTVFPGAIEACDATIDLNCDGAIGDVDGDGDGAIACEDCDDGNAAVYPGAPEVCNNVDDDCDGTKDDGVTTTYYADADGDGYGDASVSKAACTTPSGHVTDATDCDDTKASINPGATEICNGLDEDCDRTVDDGVKLDFYRDFDADGYGAASDGTTACTKPSGFVADATDCNDASAIVNPGAPEICDGIDNDCDVAVDDDDADVTGTITWYVDADDDGFGVPATPITACEQPTGYAETSDDCDDADSTTYPGAPESCDTTVDRNCDGLIGDVDNDGDGSPACADCDDTNAARYPGATETCNSVDDDCDGVVDDGVKLTFFRDKDADTYGDPLVTAQACTAPSGYVANDDDCDDNSGTVKPGGAETCNAIDDDCDGTVDDGVKTIYYIDADGDLYGSTASTTQACSVPTGYAVNSTDCDDLKAAVNPGAVEVCNAIDDDCDASIDEGVKTVFYRDADGDSFGNAASTLSACTKPSGYVTNTTDCNDGVATIYPGAPEICDGLDQDCDGTPDDGLPLITYLADSDKDGYGTSATTTKVCSTTPPTGYTSTAGDCNDADDAIHPAAIETCNGVDDDCDTKIDDDAGTLWYRDSDGDTYGLTASALKACTLPSGYVAIGGDCDDTKALVYPGATEICNSADDDCDGSADEGAGTPWYADVDVDTYGNDAVVLVQCTMPSGYVARGGDCDDADKTVYPGEYCFGGGSHILYTEAGARLENPSTALGDLGRSIAGIPDCDGDGLDDFLVGDPEASHAEIGDGRVYVVTAKPTAPALAESVATGLVYGNTAGVGMGWAVASLGDADGDGNTDFVTGAPLAGSTTVERGRIYLMNCPITTGITGTSAQAKFLGENGSDHAGFSLTGAPDIDVDGVLDFATGAPGYDNSTLTDAGAIYVVSGASATSSNITLDSTTTLTMLVGSQASAELGAALGHADADADDTLDLLIGTPGLVSSAEARGGVYVLSHASRGSLSTGDADFTLTGEALGDRAGTAVVGEADVDGDGYSDFLVGAPGNDTGGGNAGAAYLLYGGSLSSASGTLRAEATATLTGAAAGDAAGTSVALADLDGNGTAEVVVGAPFADISGTTTKANAGSVYILLDPVGTVSLSTADAIWSGNFAAEEAGSALGRLGDIDGDGWDDLGIGAAQTTSTFTPRLYILYGKDL